jgi:hypothetical protein
MAGPFQELIRPMDSLQPPARDLMPPPGDGIHLMETSRGSPHSCDFCETTRLYGRSWRPHSPERVAAEVIRLVEGHDAVIYQQITISCVLSPDAYPGLSTPTVNGIYRCLTKLSFIHCRPQLSASPSARRFKAF